MPQDLSDATGTLIEPLANAVHSVERAVREGDNVLVIGAGPIGLFAARASVLAGAARTFVVDKLPDRLGLAKGLGCRAGRGRWRGRGARGGDGWGGRRCGDRRGRIPGHRALAVKAARPGGHIDVIGLGAVEGPASYQQIVAKGLTIVGAHA